MEQNRDKSLARVTIDSSLVYPTTSRRFIMALWEMEGLKVELLPRTIQEMFGFVQDSERRHWGARTRAEAERTGVSLPAKTVSSIEKATALAAGAWVNKELGYAGIPGRNDSMLRAVALTEEQETQANALAESIPRKCFKGPSKDGHQGDRQIIAQGVVSGFKILASDNRSSIRRTQINGWLIEQKLAPGEFVLEGDDAIDQAGSWREQPAHMLEAVLRATLPTRPACAQRERDIVETFIERMRNEGFGRTADNCAEEWEGDLQKEIYARARAHIANPTTLARDTEARRMSATLAAAKKAGYVQR